MKRTLALGDVHGAHKALKQVLEKSSFDKEEDRLIFLGDIVDGWSESYECVEELLTIKNLITIKGNHCDWFIKWINTGIHPDGWRQGGYTTLQSYCKHLDKDCVNTLFDNWTTNLLRTDLPRKHIEFFMNMQDFYIQDNKCFVHGGFDRMGSIYTQSSEFIYYWDRELWRKAQSCVIGQKLQTIDQFDEIFIGHTTTESSYPDLKPVNCGRVWNLDQGAGWGGKLTLMDVNTKEYWQSDIVSTLYPDEKGKR